jgi:hypothetical protein
MGEATKKVHPSPTGTVDGLFPYPSNFSGEKSDHIQDLLQVLYFLALKQLIYKFIHFQIQHLVFFKRRPAFQIGFDDLVVVGQKA